MDDALETKAVDAIVKRVIANVVDDLVRSSIARIVGIDGRSRIPDEMQKVIMTEANTLIAEDPDVKAALKTRLLKELANTSRY